MGSRFHLPLPYAGYLKRSAANFEQISDFIRDLSPDIVGLVEVDTGSFRSDNCCQAQSLALQLGYNHISESKYREGSMVQRVPVLCNQGNAILTRPEIVDHRFHFFKQGVKRLVIEARTEDVTVFLVHLSLTYRNRQYQLEQLFKMVRQVRGPVIVAGDFNVLWGERELELFLAASGLRNANNEGVPSHPSRAPKRQLDYILYSPDLAIQDFFVPQVIFSDHSPLVCDFIHQTD